MKNTARMTILGGILLMAMACSSKQVAQPDAANATPTPVAAAAQAAPNAQAAQAKPAAGSESLDPALVAKGKHIFETNACVTCHRKGLDRPIGAQLEGVYGSKVQLTDGTTVTADDAYLRESILKPNAKVVKGYQPVMLQVMLSDDEIDALVAYIKSLKNVK